MINPLNELSSVYMQNIAEDCSKCSCGGKGCSKCDEKKKVKVKGELPGTKRPDGGDGAAPNDGKNLLATGNVPMGGSGAKRRVSKYAVEPLATEGHCVVDGVECSPTEKKKDSKRMKKESKIYSNWRENWEYLDEYASGITGYGSGDSENNLENPKAKTDNKSNQRITEKSVKNKIKINPPQGMAEAFNQIGGQLVEMYEIELDENSFEQDRRLRNQKLVSAKNQDNLNRQREQRNQQAKLAAARGSQNNNSTSPMAEENEEEKKKRELMARTKEHDDKMAGKIAEADMTGAPSIKDAKPAKKTNVKYDPHMKVMAPTIKKESRALSGVLSTIRAKNGMGTITAKGADKLQAKKEKSMGEEMSIKDQMRISREAAKNRNPNPDHRKINAMKASNQKKDNRTDSQKMTDATGPRPGSNYRGD